MKINAYEMIFRQDGEKEETPACITVTNKLPVADPPAPADSDGGEVADETPSADGDFSLQERFDKYVAEGKTKKEAMAMARSDKKDYEKKLKDEKKRKELEAKYQEMVDKGMEDIVPYLDVDGNNKILRTMHNYVVVLSMHEDYINRFNLNEFSRQDEIDKRPMSTRDFNLIGEELEMKLGYFELSYVRAAVSNVCTRNPYHPVKEVVDTLVWDKVSRAETFFIDRVGGEDTPLTREMSFKWLYAMVKRIYEPGCFFDHYLVLTDSTQGTGKTGTFQRLTEGLNTSMGSLTNENISIDTTNKDNVLALLDCSIGLLDESSKVKYGDKCEAFKAFMSQRTLVYRPVWGTYNEHPQIHHVIAMTTNDENFLTDSSGDFERRAWVIRCQGDPNRSPEEWEKYNSDEVIQQVWAELKYYYDNQDKAPYKVTGKNVTILSEQGKADLLKLQKEVKTMNEDFPCENAITAILEGQKYKSDIFFTAKDFCTDRDSFRFEEEKYTHDLNVIPANWLYEYINKMIGSKGNRSSRYIRQMILSLSESGKIGKWEIDNHRYYNKKQTTCWVRVTDGDVDKKAVEKNPETEQKKHDLWNEQNNLPK